MSKFDPMKPFGTIQGQFSEHPSARYSQGVFFYDVHRRCLNPDTEAPEEGDVIDDATQNLIEQARVKADEALLKFQRAKAAVADGNTSPQAKGAVTRTRKSYEKAQAKLDKLLS